jgi:E3 ubiquitin-protein ligase TRIP12
MVVMQHVPMASFTSAILSSKDHPGLVLSALQLAELLLVKLPDDFTPAFRREGVFHELHALAQRTTAVKKDKEKEKEKEKEKDKDKEEPGSPTPEPPPTAIPPALAATIPGYKKLGAMGLEPEDAVTLRARVVQFRHAREAGGASAGLAGLARVAGVLGAPAGEDEVRGALGTLTALFRAGEAAVSSFELLQSGVVNALMTLATAPDGPVPLARRQQLLFDAFGAEAADGQTALAVLVKKLQESLTRMEAYDVVTVSQGDGRRTPHGSRVAC